MAIDFQEKRYPQKEIEKYLQQSFESLKCLQYRSRLVYEQVQ